jgi:hypothetical protein
MSTLTIISQALAFDDDEASSNPSRLPVNWKRTIANIAVDHAATEPLQIEPMGVATVIDGTRSTSIDGTTAFSIAPNPIDASRYRIARTGGTPPLFRTDRSLALSGVALTLAVTPSLAMTVTAVSGSFSGVLPGDVVFIPGVSTGDSAGPFNVLNEGFWTVLTVTATVLTMTRVSGQVFNGVGESVTPGSNTALQAFSASGVQVGDTVELVSGFATTSRRAYEIVAVTPTWIEFLSTAPLGAETGVLPTATGILFYTNAKRFIYIETDQECVVRLNGDTGDKNKLVPWVAGQKNFVAEFRMTGTVWKLVLVNKASTTAQAVVISAE